MALYDYIIAGAGASGLALAYAMASSEIAGHSILLVDRESKTRNNRTWCFWSDRETRLDHLVYRTWERLEVVSDSYREAFDLRPYQFKMIRGIDYYQGMREALETVQGVTFQPGRVTQVGDAPDKKGAEVIADGVPYGARFAFDSTYKVSDYFTGPPGYHYLKQHFKGWEIETPADSFDPRTVTMFDFRTPQKGSMRFFTILPFARRRALVSYNICSADLLKPHEYDRSISEYIEGVLRIPRYRTESVESGVIPMTDRPFRRRQGKFALAIGTRGGLVKPSTGYAFLRLQHDAEGIVRSLVNYGHPFHLSVPPRRYRLYDSLMLQMMHRQGDSMKGIFTRLFRKNSIQSIFRFFDEDASLAENARLLSSLPWSPFLNALLRVKLLRKV